MLSIVNGAAQGEEFTAPFQPLTINHIVIEYSTMTKKEKSRPNSEYKWSLNNMETCGKCSIIERLIWYMLFEKKIL